MDRKLNIELSDNISELRYSLKHFQVRTRRFKIFFRGKSLDFDGYRPFTFDDDIVNVDWRASQRSDQLLVRQYKEEEDKKVIFLIDVGETMVAGSTKKLKCEYAAEIALSLTDLILNFNDRVGMILYNDKVKEFYPPNRGKRLFNIYIDTLSDPGTYGGGSNIIPAANFIMQNFDKTVSAVVIISDFLNFNSKIAHALELIGNKYETMAFMVKDPSDLTLPEISAEFLIEDPKTGQQMLVEPKLAKKMYEKNAKEQEDLVIEALKNSNIDYLKFVTDKPFVHDMINFLENRVMGR